MRESYTASVERNTLCAPGFASEPYETAWATEAIFFIRFLDGNKAGEGRKGPIRFAVEISPDGMRWCPEGAECEIPLSEEMGFVRVRHFGSWLRIRRLDDTGGSVPVLVHLVLK